MFLTPLLVAPAPGMTPWTLLPPMIEDCSTAISRHLSGFCCPSGSIILKFSSRPSNTNVDDDVDDDRLLLSSEKLVFNTEEVFVVDIGGVFTGETELWLTTWLLFAVGVTNDFRQCSGDVLGVQFWVIWFLEEGLPVGCWWECSDSGISEACLSRLWSNTGWPGPPNARRLISQIGGMFWVIWCWLFGNWLDGMLDCPLDSGLIPWLSWMLKYSGDPNEPLCPGDGRPALLPPDDPWSGEMPESLFGLCEPCSISTGSCFYKIKL